MFLHGYFFNKKDKFFDDSSLQHREHHSSEPLDLHGLLEKKVGLIKNAEEMGRSLSTHVKLLKQLMLDLISDLGREYKPPRALIHEYLLIETALNLLGKPELSVIEDKLFNIELKDISSIKRKGPVMKASRWLRAIKKHTPLDITTLGVDAFTTQKTGSLHNILISAAKSLKPAISSPDQGRGLPPLAQLLDRQQVERQQRMVRR